MDAIVDSCVSSDDNSEDWSIGGPLLLESKEPLQQMLMYVFKKILDSRPQAVIPFLSMKEDKSGTLPGFCMGRSLYPLATSSAQKALLCTMQTALGNEVFDRIRSTPPIPLLRAVLDEQLHLRIADFANISQSLLGCTSEPSPGSQASPGSPLVGQVRQRLPRPRPRGLDRSPEPCLCSLCHPPPAIFLCCTPWKG
jgi:hypothetical protein